MGVWRPVCMGLQFDFLPTKHIVFQKQGLSPVGTSHVARLGLGNIRLTDASDTQLGGLITPQGLEEVSRPRARCCLVTTHLAGVFRGTAGGSTDERGDRSRSCRRRRRTKLLR